MTTEGEPPLKLACATCIQGHRASTCKHQDGSKGPLLVVKRRGRPLSQCAECREKRLRTGRHSRCDCNARAKAKEESEIPNVAPSYPPMKRHNMQSPLKGSSQRRKRSSPLSFEFILNPCRCKEGSACTCCQSHLDYLFENKSAPTFTSQPSYTPPIGNTCSLDSMKHYKEETPAEKTSCCKNVTNVDRATAERSMDLLVRAADMSKSFSLECQCGPKCRCQGCLAMLSNEGTSKEKTGPACGSCVACDIQSQNPTGIEPVDRWAQVTHIKHNHPLSS